jgi:hypothetical protein
VIDLGFRLGRVGVDFDGGLLALGRLVDLLAGLGGVGVHIDFDRLAGQLPVDDALPAPRSLTDILVGFQQRTFETVCDFRRFRQNLNAGSNVDAGNTGHLRLHLLPNRGGASYPGGSGTVGQPPSGVWSGPVGGVCAIGPVGGPCGGPDCVGPHM